jgi:GNAT superfamily N-acetyltransferase
VRADELAPVPWPEAAKRDFLAQQADLQHNHYIANYPGADLLVIESDLDSIGRDPIERDPIGSVPIGRIYVYRSKAEIRLMDIALVPDWRNRGIGTSLLRELMAEALATGSSLTLHVEPNNPAQRMYERLGFRLIEHRGVYDFLGWNYAETPAGDNV